MLSWSKLYLIFVFSECSSSEQRCISEHEISSQQRCQAAQLYQHQTSSSSVSWSQSRVHGEVPGHVHPHRHGAAHPAQHEADCSGGDSVTSETRIISVSKHVPSLQSAVSVSWSILSISEWQLLTPVISSSQDWSVHSCQHSSCRWILPGSCQLSFIPWPGDDSCDHSCRTSWLHMWSLQLPRQLHARQSHRSHHCYR